MANPPFKRRVRYVKPPHYLDRFADADLAGDGDLAALKRQENDQDSRGLGPLLATTFPEPNFGLRFTDKGAGAVRLTETYSGLSVTPTFTRATTATTVLANGLIGSVASGTARSYYDPTSLAYLGYLAEGARTNLLLQSEDFATSWNVTDTTITANTSVAPDGATTADTATEGTAGTATLNQAVTATADATYSTFRYLKRGNTDWVQMRLNNGANVAIGWFNLLTGVTGSVSNGGTATGAVIRIKAHPNGWYRCELAAAVGSGATAITTATMSAAADNNLTRVNNATYLIWGGQFENNVSFASSYIPTTVATVTRNADVLTYPFTNLSGTLFASGRIFGVAAVNGILSMNDGTFNNAADLRPNSTANAAAFIASGTVTQATMLGTTWTVNVDHKMALAFALNDANMASDGVLATPDTSVTLPVGITTLNVGSLHTGTNQNFGTVSSIAYYRSRLLDADLKRMTGPAFSL